MYTLWRLRSVTHSRPNIPRQQRRCVNDDRGRIKCQIGGMKKLSFRTFHFTAYSSLDSATVVVYTEPFLSGFIWTAVRYGTNCQKNACCVPHLQQERILVQFKIIYFNSTLMDTILDWIWMIIIINFSVFKNCSWRNFQQTWKTDFPGW